MRFWQWCFRGASAATVVATFGAPLWVVDGSTDPALQAVFVATLALLVIAMGALSVLRARGGD